MTKGELIDFLNNSLIISEKIAIRYELIKTLEQTNLKDSLMYNGAKMDLLREINREKELFEKAKISVEDALAMNGILCTEKRINFGLSVTEQIFNCSDFPPALRTFYKLNQIVDHNLEYLYNRITKGTFEMFSNYFNKNDILCHIKIDLVLQDSIIKNYYLVFMAFLDSLLEKREFSCEIIDKIRHAKYLLPYLATNLEENFYNYDFKIPNSLCLDYKFFLEMFHLPSFLESSVVSNIISNEIKNNIIQLL